MSTSTVSLGDFRNMLVSLEGKATKTDMSNEDRLRRASATMVSKLDRDMAVDLETCIHCGMCAEACHFYEATGEEKYAPIHKVLPLRQLYRRELSPFRWFYRPFTRKLDVEQLQEWQVLVYDGCTECGRCDMMCPMGINLSSMITVMREGIAAAGLAPDELQSLSKEQQNDGSIFGVGREQFRERLADLAQAGIEIPLDRDRADVLVLTSAVDILLFPDSLAAIARIMNKLGADWTMSSDVFEASNVGLIAGDDRAQKEATAAIIEFAKACGAKTVVLPESGHAYQALRWEGANQVGESPSFDILAPSEYIAAEIRAGKLKLKRQTNGASVSYHDPCRLGRHGGVFEEPREIIKALGIELKETESNKVQNYCCGGGCGEYVINRAAPLRRAAFAIKQREFDHAAADAVVTSCANCRVNLSAGAEDAGWQTPVKGLTELVAANLDD